MKGIFNIEGKVALVTGSTGALGNTFARGLAQHGATVILNGRNNAKLNEKVQEFINEGLTAYGYAFDVTRKEELNLAISRINDEVGPVDILVNNAGINLRAPLEEYKDEDWDKVIGLNLTGPYLVAKAVVQSMIKRKGGKIINIGSIP